MKPELALVLDDCLASLRGSQAELRSDTAEREAKHAALERSKATVWRQRVADVVPVLGAADVFGNLQATSALRAVQSWLEQDGARGLCIRGPVGTGKSIAALYAVRHWLEPRVEGTRFASPTPVSWLRPDELVSATLHAYDATAPKLRRHVVVDDLGRETKADVGEALSRLLEAVDAGPFGERGPHVVVITSNLTRDAMRARYEPRVIDRLNQRCVAIDVRGPSLRPDGGF